MNRILRIPAPVVQKITDIVCTKHRKQTFILATVPTRVCQLVTTGAKGTTRRIPQRPNRLRVLSPHIQQPLLQDAQNAVLRRINMGHPGGMPTGRLYHSAGGGIDDGGYTARLGVAKIFGLHGA